MHDVLDDGRTVQCVLAGLVTEGEWKEDEWSKKLDRAALERVLEGWGETPLRDGIIEVRMVILGSGCTGGVLI
jgi:hypothetical protein